ncbi:MAG: DUF6918 family protein [Nocardioidaceae bacterium]
MADNLQATLLHTPRRQAVVQDLEKLVNAEVADKRGMSGLAIKSGYGVVKRVNASFVPRAIDGMLDDFVVRIQPFYDEFVQSPHGSFADHLAAHSSTVADSLLVVTDDRAGATKRESVKKAYGRLRPQAKKHVEQAIPRLGALIERRAKEPA